jgi:hypothetical protein
MLGHDSQASQRTATRFLLHPNTVPVKHGRALAGLGLPSLLRLAHSPFQPLPNTHHTKSVLTPPLFKALLAPIRLSAIFF